MVVSKLQPARQTVADCFVIVAIETTPLVGFGFCCLIDVEVNVAAVVGHFAAIPNASSMWEDVFLTSFLLERPDPLGGRIVLVLLYTGSILQLFSHSN